MKLIDGEIQSKRLTNYILERKETFARALEKGDNDFIFAMLMDYFDEQPTAYDVDKVVQQLELLKKYDLNLADMMFDIQSNGLGRHFICLEDAIEIVKAGGVNHE